MVDNRQIQQDQQREQLSLKIKYLKLKRVTELNNKLKNELSRERITASNACLTIVNYVSTHRDYTVPEIWGYPQPGSNHFAEDLRRRGSVQNSKRNPMSSNNCCNIM